MSLKFHAKNGSEYVSYAKSIRSGDSVRTEYMYIGKVIDRSTGLFYNRKLGYVVFDDESKTVLPAPAAILPSDALEEEECILDFGNTFFLDAYMRRKGLMACIESIGCDNVDTLCSLVMHYALTHQSTKHIRCWYEGNYTRELYPEAELGLQDVLDFMDSFGSEESLSRFLDSYFRLVTGRSMDEYGGRETDGEFTISVSNFGKNFKGELPVSSSYKGIPAKNKDLRLIMVFQKDTGIPIYFRYVPDRLMQVTGISAMNRRMESLGVGVNFALTDSKYCDFESISKMCEDRIPSRSWSRRERRTTGPSWTACPGTSVQSGRPASTAGSGSMYSRYRIRRVTS